MSKIPPLIAIVDDEDSVRQALERLMCAAGLTAETFVSGADFVASLQHRQPDCVVLDLHMPGTSGHDVQVFLQSSARRVPVVVITGHDTPEARRRALDDGAVAYLRKPCASRELLDAVARALAAKAD